MDYIQRSLIHRKPGSFLNCLFLITGFFISGYSTVNAQTWAHQLQSTFYKDIFLPVSDDTLYAVTGQHLKFSYNAGQDWDSSFIHSNINGRGLQRTPDRTLWIWGTDNQTFGMHMLLRSRNNGNSWDTIIDYSKPGTRFSFPFHMDAQFSDSLRGMIFVNDSLFSTADGGGTFIYSGLKTDPYSFDFKTDHWAVFGMNDSSKNILYTSLDSGQHWHETELLSNIGWSLIQLKDTNSIYYTGGLYIFKYNFSTRFWDTLNINFPFDRMYDFHVVSNDTILVINDSTVHRSVNGGYTFSQENINKNVTLNKFYRAGNTWYVAGFNDVFKFFPNGIPNSLEETEITRKIPAIWPNPTSGNISFAADVNGYEIFDCFGRMIEKDRIDLSKGVNIDYLPYGVYYFRLFGSAGIEVLPVVKY
jgi:hypothetical protein